MNKAIKTNWAGVILSLAWLPALLAGTVDLTLYNTAQLLDFNMVTPLQGSTNGGDLVQLIRAGTNGIINNPNPDGSPGGDDVLVACANNPTFVGAGVMTPNNGKLVQSGMVYNDTNAGASVYVRFWNSSSINTDSYFGASSIFALPAADSFGLAEYDFVPSEASPRTANVALVSVAIPTLSEWGVICLTALVLWVGARKIMRRQTAAAGGTDSPCTPPLPAAQSR